MGQIVRKRCHFPPRLSYWTSCESDQASQVARHSGQVCLKVAHDWLKVVCHCLPVAFQVRGHADRKTENIPVLCDESLKAQPAQPSMQRTSTASEHGCSASWTASCEVRGLLDYPRRTKHVHLLSKAASTSSSDASFTSGLRTTSPDRALETVMRALACSSKASVL